MKGTAFVFPGSKTLAIARGHSFYSRDIWLILEAEELFLIQQVVHLLASKSRRILAKAQKNPSNNKLQQKLYVINKMFLWFVTNLTLQLKSWFLKTFNLEDLSVFNLSVCILILYITFKQFITLQHLCSILLSDIIWPHEETFHLVQTLHSGSQKRFPVQNTVNGMSYFNKSQSNFLKYF